MQKHETLYRKYLKLKRARGVCVVQGVEHLPSKYKALSSNSNTAKRIVNGTINCYFFILY
jgi:hypothetical protein